MKWRARRAKQQSLRRSLPHVMLITSSASVQSPHRAQPAISPSRCSHRFTTAVERGRSLHVPPCAAASSSSSPSSSFGDATGEISSGAHMPMRLTTHEQGACSGEEHVRRGLRCCGHSLTGKQQQQRDKTPMQQKVSSGNTLRSKRSDGLQIESTSA